MCPSVDPSTCLLIDLSLYLATHLSIYLSMYLWILRCIDLSIYRSIYPSIDLAIKSHCTYPLLCFKNRCLQELPLRYFPSSAYGCTIRVGDKTDAKRRRYGNNKVTCCRLGSAARKDKSKYEACSGPRKKNYRVSQLNAALSQVTLVRKNTSDFCMRTHPCNK